MHRLSKVVVVWAIVFSLCVLSAGVVMALVPREQEEGPVMKDGTTEYWSFDTRHNDYKQHIWTIYFDDFFPGDDEPYYVYAEFIGIQHCDAPNVSGTITLIIDYWLNREWVAGIWRDAPFSGNCHNLHLGHSNEDSFTNTTPQDNDNLFEARVQIYTDLTQTGDGRLAVQLGPLELHGKRSTESAALVGFFIAAYMSALLALPASYYAVRLSERRHVGVPGYENFEESDVML